MARLHQRRPFRRGGARIGFMAGVALLAVPSAPPASAVTLKDFGYQNMRASGVQRDGGALGRRPLLVILANFEGQTPLAHSQATYDTLVFNTLRRSVNGYFLVNSNGRFSWARAGEGTIGPLSLSKELLALQDPPRMAKVLEAVAAAGFDFAPFDENRDGNVTSDELGILIIDNITVNEGANRSTDPVCVRPAGSRVSLCLRVAAAGHRAGLMTICHELMHSLGALDLYGANCHSQGLTLMSCTIGPPDDPGTFHLDPWHKMQLGWCEPRVRSLRTPGTERLPAANMVQPDAPVLLYDPARGTSEYFILEYRSARNRAGLHYDENVAGTGLVIWQIRQDANRNALSIDGFGATVVALGAPGLARGGSGFWGSAVRTPMLRWWDGVSTEVRVQTQPFAPTDSAMVISYRPAMGEAVISRINPGGAGYTDLLKEQWRPGWTHFVPFSLQGQPYFLSYRAEDTGEAVISRVRSDGRGYTDVFKERWRPGWTHFMPFSLQGQPYFLSYRGDDTGEAVISRVRSDGAGITDVSRGKWRTGWTHFMPFTTAEGWPHFLSYRSDTGEMSISRINPGGAGTTDVFKERWRPGWTHFMPVSLQGQPYFLSYRGSDTGEAAISRIRPNGAGYTDVWAQRWRTGWAHFVPFVLQGQPHYLSYRADTGEAVVSRLKPDGQGSENVWGDRWRPGWTHFMPFVINGQPYILSYRD